MDAWETRFGEQRAAAIDRLEQLCLEKYHLKMPSVSTNQNSKAKKKNVDISQLKAPTPSNSQSADSNAQESTSITHQDDKTDQQTAERQQEPISASHQQPISRPHVKAGQIKVTAKPHGIRTSFSPLGNGKLITSRKSSLSPEPMSIGGESERSSRSPSPQITPDQPPLDNNFDNQNHNTDVMNFNNSVTTTTSEAASASVTTTISGLLKSNSGKKTREKNLDKTSNDTNDNAVVIETNVENATETNLESANDNDAKNCNV